MANQFITDEHTSVMQRLVQQIVNDPSTYLGAKYLPSVQIMSNKIRAEVIESNGGLTNEHAIGTDPVTIQSFGTHVEEFSPGTYKEQIYYGEDDILFLRQLGQNDPSKRGVRQYIDKDVDRLNRRIEARIEKLRWDAIFNGGFSFYGRTFSYGIPSANQAVPVTAVWSTDGINANAAANPLIDLRYWVTGGLAAFRKYKITKIIMNGNTQRWILDNANTRSYVQNALANPHVNNYSLDQVLGFFIPGCPAVDVYNGWYQSESLVGEKIVASDAIYFIPDGYIFFECSLPGGDTIGEFQQTINLASGTVDQPGTGKFLVVEENIAPGTKGGPQNPYISLVGGVYGAPNLFRSFDTITAKVV